MNAIAVDATMKDNLLSLAASGNAATDLVVVRGENLQATLQSRFLRVEAERLLLEVPISNDRPVILQPGQFVEVYFKLDHERLGFDSRVIGYTRIESSDGSGVECVAIATPHTLERRQRRKFYRVSVAALPTMVAHLWPAGADPVASRAIETKLCNLSAGGVALLVDRQRWQFGPDDVYQVQFRLPDDSERFCFEAVVCHVRHVFHSRRQIVGLAFLPNDGEASHRAAIDRIAQFVASQQRDNLFQSRHLAPAATPV